MNWFFIALSAYLLLAIANLLDKFLVDNVLKSSKAYAFVVCVLGASAILIAPWFLKWPGFSWLMFNLLIGGVFAGALWALYEALKKGEAARVLVFIGGLTPVFSIIFTILFFKESYSLNQWLGMGALLMGVLFIALLPQPRSFLARLMAKLGLKQKVKQRGLLIALLSAFLYALYFVGTKHAYNHRPFLSVFIWTRLGAALLVLTFLFKKAERKIILGMFKKSSPTKKRGLVVFNQVLGSSGFVLQNYAVFLGPVAIVNALQGFQYAFILIISAILAVVAPKKWHENFSWRIILQKSIAVVLVGIGLYFIAI